MFFNLGMMTGGTRIPLIRSVSRTGVALSTLTTSPIFRFPDSVGAADEIAVDVGEYRLYDAGVWGEWTSDAGVRGTATKIQFRLTSSAAYETQVVQTATVDAVEYTISVTTMAEPSGDNSVVFGAETDVWFGEDNDVIFGS